MVIRGKKILEKLIAKNRGNRRLAEAVDQLIIDLERNSTHSIQELLEIRKDADRVHRGYYFFDICVHRALIFIQFVDNKATIVWAGTHEEYVKTFKNNINTIEKWLRARDLLD
ncbi:type II toxin-antitoxin system HigB family toxin [Dyadobacter sp. MSC1_007]|jgi:hypothetical protein|uniref:type II toxin-antitoxin system HigB family toxin n=1 Tax=Dyadobacter sp. MSC1_007 TaxID=2909264 RepID=UPI00203005F1|nr:type II toxin-antitoxin system HigB family toxin [Dyadobacter sp. MSC1_007]